MRNRIVGGVFRVIIVVAAGVVVFALLGRLTARGCGDSSTIPFPLYPDAQAVWICHYGEDFTVSFRTDAPPERVLEFYRGQLSHAIAQDTGTQLIASWGSGAIQQSLRDDPMHGSWTPPSSPGGSFSFDAVVVEVHRQWWLFGETVVSMKRRSIHIAVDPSP
jgi:hypothetical protein